MCRPGPWFVNGTAILRRKVTISPCTNVFLKLVVNVPLSQTSPATECQDGSSLVKLTQLSICAVHQLSECQGGSSLVKLTQLSICAVHQLSEHDRSFSPITPQRVLGEDVVKGKEE